MSLTTTTPAAVRPHYGIDAPGLVRGFFLAATAGLAVAVGAGLWGATALAALAGVAAAYCGGMGCYMLYFSLVHKVRERETLLDLVPWVGAEAVLDVGCGRGLLLTAAARRVPAGRAVGVDIWSAADQSGNRPEVTLANARAEGVESRVEVRTADMRALPFPDQSFDVVVSHWAVHNLPTPAERAVALGEMARVLGPKGRLLLVDIGLHAEYEALLATLGFVGIRRVVSQPRDAVLAVITGGSFRPAAVLASRPLSSAPLAP